MNSRLDRLRLHAPSSKPPSRSVPREDISSSRGESRPSSSSASASRRKPDSIGAEDVELEEMEEGRSGRSKDSSKVDEKVKRAAHGYGTLDEFFLEVEEVKRCLAGIQSDMEEIDHVHQDKLVCTVMSKQEVLHARMGELLESAGDHLRRAQSILKSMEEKNERMKTDVDAKGVPRVGIGERRLRESQFQTLSKSLVELSTKLHEMEGQHLMQWRNRLRGELEIANENATEEDVNRYISAGKSNAFASLTFGHDQSAEANTIRTEYAVANQELRDIQQLEAAMNDVEELMVEFCNMVFAQSPLVDRISTNITQAENYMEQGYEELVKAHNYQKKARKKKCCMILIICIIAVVLISGLGGGLGVGLG